MNTHYGCKTTKEQKEQLIKRYNQLKPNSWESYNSYANLHLSDGRLMPTNRMPEDYDAKNYFNWISFEQFNNICLMLLFTKRKQKM